MKKLLRRTLIGLGVAGFILAALTVVVFNKSTLGWQANSVPTGSMRPMMPPGSLVLVHHVPLSSLKVGDVITHTNPLTMRTTLTHRIVKEYKIKGKIPAFVTKGDANPSPDPAFVGGLVKGKMVFHVPYAGWLLMWAKTWIGITVLVYIPALLIMVNETRLLAEYLRLRRPYRLEGTAHLYPSHEPKPSMRPKWAMAASTAFAVVIAATGWQAAGALVSPPGSTMLLDFKANVIQAKAEPGSVQRTTQTNCANTDVHNATTQQSQAGTAANQGSSNNGGNDKCRTTGVTGTKLKAVTDRPVATSGTTSSAKNN